eukprot:8413807-Pyramimonas_sp.AAC.1
MATRGLRAAAQPAQRAELPPRRDACTPGRRDLPFLRVLPTKARLRRARWQRPRRRRSALP